MDKFRSVFRKMCDLPSSSRGTNLLATGLPGGVYWHLIIQLQKVEIDQPQKVEIDHVPSSTDFPTVVFPGFHGILVKHCPFIHQLPN